MNNKDQGRLGRGPTAVRLLGGLLLAILLMGCDSQASEPHEATLQPAALATAPSAGGKALAEEALGAVDHRVWDAFLQTQVVAGEDGIHRLDYAAIDTAERAALGTYLARLEATAVSALDSDEQMAFWINLYNALTVRVILEHLPLESILEIDLSPPSDGPWDAKITKVEGRELSLNEIEHGILRPTWADPRIHYAVNCASIGCPNLAQRAFTADNLEDLLEASAETFVNHPRGVRFEDEDLVVSNIFLWYREDFGDSEEGIVEHLTEYAEEPLASRLEGYDGALRGDYDWRLNGL